MTNDIQKGPLEPAPDDGDIQRGPLEPASADGELKVGPLEPAADTSEIQAGPLPPASEDSPIQAGPLAPAPPDSEIHPGPLAPSSEIDVGERVAPPAAAAAAGGWWRRRTRPAVPAGEVAFTEGAAVAAPARKLSWREQRWERRRKRRRFEEVLGWVLVPIILISGYWAVKATLNALGTSPTGLIQGLQTLLAGSN